MHAEIDGAQRFNALAKQAAEARGRTVSELAKEAKFDVSALRQKKPRDHGLRMYKKAVEQLDRWRPLSAQEIVGFAPYWLPEKYFTNSPSKWILAIQAAVKEVANLNDDLIVAIADLACQRIGLIESTEAREPVGPMLDLTDEPSQPKRPRGRSWRRRSR